MKKACKILTEKEYEYIKNCIQNIAVNVEEYRFILSKQMNLISDINTVLLMQYKAQENLIAQNDKITKKCISLTEQFDCDSAEILTKISRINDKKRSDES